MRNECHNSVVLSWGLNSRTTQVYTDDVELVLLHSCSCVCDRASISKVVSLCAGNHCGGGGGREGRGGGWGWDVDWHTEF